MGINFSKKDFENIKYTILLVNQTSGTDCKDIDVLKVVNIDERGVTLTAPFNSCNINHNVMVCFLPGLNPKIPKNLSFEGKNKEVFFSAIGKVKNKIESDDPDICEVELLFSQYDKKIWTKIVNEYKRKQVSIVDLFKKIGFHE